MHVRKPGVTIACCERRVGVSTGLWPGPRAAARARKPRRGGRRDATLQHTCATQAIPSLLPVRGAVQATRKYVWWKIETVYLVYITPL